MFDLVILDLNMPIADGYEACRNIKSIFNRQTVLGKKQKPLNLRRQESMHSDKMLLLKCENYILNDYVPFIVAVTANITDEVKKQVNMAGFNNLYSVPLTVATIKEELMP